MSQEQNQRQGRFLRAFLSSVLGTGLSRVLGAVRDITLASFLGASATSDAFFIAFTVPNVFRRFVADEGLTGALIPSVAKAESEEGTPEAKKLANSILGALVLANIVICLVGMLGAEWLVYAFAASFAEDPDKFAITVTMTRWMFPFVALVSVVSFFEGLLNYRGHFFVPKVAPGLVSLGIAGAAWWAMLWGTSFEQPVFALVVGVLVGGLAHVLINVPPVITRWGMVSVSFSFSSPRLRALMKELGKAVAIGIFAQLNILVLRQLAAAVGDGAITWYWNANRLVDLSQGMIAVAIGSALLPNISQSVADADWERVRTDLVGALRLASFLLIPVVASLVVFALPLAAIFFRHGNYTWTDVLW
ncbi:MAG: murein biosynthesis integral membrane protein MurJ, partial [Proteobacteria bacterium]|nr:murein biosynthesis integral membrane protein MurJ [Pseudomonadota bacterium]